MTKKGYQKRLPAVLPPTGPPHRPAPRPASPDEGETGHHVDVANPDEVDAPDVVVQDVDGDLSPPGRPSLTLAVPAPRVSTEVTPTDDEQVPARQRSPALRRLAVVGVAGLAGVVFVALGFALVSFVVPRDDRPASGAGSPEVVADTGPPVTLAGDDSYIRTRVLAGGDVVVRQWIRPDAPIDRLALSLPRVPGISGLSATGVVVLADGARASGPTRLDGRRATYTFEPTTDVELRYRLSGAVELSRSTPGRALAQATSLDVTYAPRAAREIRVVRASAVLALACAASTTAPPVPCGTSDGPDKWTVELTGARVTDRVVAQVTID